MDTKVDVGRIRTRARELSKSLLGAQFRAEVAAFIAVGEAPFWARRMSGHLGIPENKVAAELSRFAEQNLLVAISPSVWDRRTLYEASANSESYWAAAADLLQRSAAEEGLRTGVEADVAYDAYLAEVHAAPSPSDVVRGDA